MASYKRYKTEAGYRWMVQFNIGKDPITGKYKRTTRRGFKRKQDAEDAVREILGEVAEGNFVQHENVTFETVYNKWMEDEKKRLKPSTIYSKSCKFEKHILPNFKKLYFNEITTEQYQNFIDDLAEKLKSFKEYGNQIDLLYRYAKKKKIVKHNPMDFIVYPYVKDEYSDVEEDDGEIQFWEKETVTYFLSRCEEELPFRTYAMFRTLLFTGIRKGELGALLEDDFNTDKKEISITKNLFWRNGEYLLLTPKTKNSIRKISLDHQTFEVLLKLKNLNKQLRKEHGNPDIEHFLFPRPSNLKPNRLAHANDQLNSACAKFNVKNIKVHGLRHTHASMLFASGARMKDIQMRLGHARITTTMDIYTHLVENSDERLTSLLSGYFEEYNEETEGELEDEK